MPLVPGPLRHPGKLESMTLPIIATAVADAGQGGDRDPDRRWVALRAEVGRLSLHRVPRRRPDRTGQPQRATVHSVLPRAARSRCCRRCRSVASSTARSSCRRPMIAGSTSMPCCSASTRPSHACAAWRPRRRRRSSSSTCSPSTTTRCWITRWQNVIGSSPSKLAGAAPPVYLCPHTHDAATAQRWFTEFEGAGLDGVVAKRLGDPYTPDKRTLIKVKHQRTADCVIAGYRIHKDGNGVGLAAARSVRRRRRSQPRRRRGVVHGQATRRAARRARAAHPRCARQPSVEGLGGVDGPSRGQRQADAGRRQPMERRQGSQLGSAAHRTRRRGDVRPVAGRAVPPRLAVRPLEAGS